MVTKEEFMEITEAWEASDTRNSAQKFRDKFCGDCKHHRETQSCNSGSYTNCEITNASVCFGEKCTCGKFELKSW